MKIIKFVFIALVLVATGFGLWYYQPWSDYSPAKLASLEDPEKLAWNFQNMKELVPARVVTHGTPKPLRENLAPLELTYEFDGKSKTLDQFLAESTTSGLLVMKDGVVVHEWYLQGADRETLSTSWSMAKSVVATAIAIAVKEGAIESLDDEVQKYAPQYSGTDYGDSTLRNLLMMSSGINFVENYGEGYSDVRPFFFDSFVLGKNPDELLKPFQRNRQPRSDFDYISPNSHVLSSVLRGVYGKDLVEIISEKIWQPLGMESDANWLTHKDGPEGQELGYCCLNSRLRDYARFGKFYVDAIRGQGPGVELLPDGWTDLVRNPPTEHHQPGEGSVKYSGRGYTYHFWLPKDAPGVFFAAGVYGQFIWMDPERNLVIARTSADPQWTPRYSESEAVFKAISEFYQ